MAQPRAKVGSKAWHRLPAFSVDDEDGVWVARIRVRLTDAKDPKQQHPIEWALTGAKGTSLLTVVGAGHKMLKNGLKLLEAICEEKNVTFTEITPDSDKFQSEDHP